MNQEILAMLDRLVAQVRDEDRLEPGRTWHGKAIDAVWLDNQLQAVRWMLGAPMPEWLELK